MSEYLRLTHNLLVSLGGISSPEVFPLPDLSIYNQDAAPKSLDFKTGTKKFEPMSFAFFQGSLQKAYVVGHIPQENGPALPVFFAIVASGILARHNGEMSPFFPPVIREIVVIPEGLPDSDEIIDSHVESGLDIETYKTDTTYKNILKNATERIIDLLSEVKEHVFLTFNTSIEDDSEDYFVLVDGSLKPTPSVLEHSNWVGIYNNPPLSPVEEEVSLGLGENEMGTPFALKGESGYFWHLRMYSDYRKDPGWGIIRIENALTKDNDMESKIVALSAGILHERYPLHPLSEKENWRMYPLIVAKVFLQTQTTDDKSILNYF